MFFEKLGKVFDMTKWSNRNPCSPAIKPNALYTSPSYMGITNLLFPLVSFVLPFLSLSLFTPFVSRSSFLPCSSYALASFACASFVFVFLSRLFRLFPDLLSFRTFLSVDKSFARVTSFACVSVSSFLIIQGFVFRKVSRARTFFRFFKDR